MTVAGIRIQEDINICILFRDALLTGKITTSMHDFEQAWSKPVCLYIKLNGLNFIRISGHALDKDSDLNQKQYYFDGRAT